MRNVLSQSYAGLNLGTFITRILLWMVAGLAISTVSAYVLTATGLMNSIGTMSFGFVYRSVSFSLYA